MKCPYCGFEESKVIDSRPTDEGERIRRRRECLNCQKRFTTYEIIESLPIIVIKKDKTREQFSREKLLNGLVRACEKRPVSLDTIEKIVDDIEATISNSLDREVSTRKIGELIMEKLKNVDEVAYVRFASVYRQFSDVNTFFEELSEHLFVEVKELSDRTDEDVFLVKGHGHHEGKTHPGRAGRFLHPGIQRRFPYGTGADAQSRPRADCLYPPAARCSRTGSGATQKAEEKKHF